MLKDEIDSKVHESQKKYNDNRDRELELAWKIDSANTQLQSQALKEENISI
jgi:hypothetical protein